MNDKGMIIVEPPNPYSFSTRELGKEAMSAYKSLPNELYPDDPKSKKALDAYHNEIARLKEQEQKSKAVA
jgi:hypothetical protein